MNLPETRHVTRREAVRWMLAASASISLLDHQALNAGPAPGAAKPYGLDPALNEIYAPGDFWPLTLNAPQRRTLTSLCDLIIPGDDRSPGAGAVGVPDFIDEWISAPYPAQQIDRPLVLGGLKWLEAESRRRFKTDFADLTPAQQTRIADEICWLSKSKSKDRAAAQSFAVLRRLISGGYYTTPAGMKDIGFVGNVALMSFPDPPPEVLQKLGLRLPLSGSAR